MAEFIHGDIKVIKQILSALSGLKPIVPSMACPEQGAFIGYKVGLTFSGITVNSVPCLITLAVPEDAKRSSAYGNKCRCNKAKVLCITTFGGLRRNVAVSLYDCNFIYKINEVVSVPDFDENRWHECAPGIHFFMSEKEALDYWGVI